MDDAIHRSGHRIIFAGKWEAMQSLGEIASAVACHRPTPWRRQIGLEDDQHQLAISFSDKTMIFIEIDGRQYQRAILSGSGPILSRKLW